MVVNLAAASHVHNSYRKSARSVQAARAALIHRFKPFTITVDAALLVNDNLATVSQLESYLRSNLKVYNRIMSSKYVTITTTETSLTICVKNKFSNNDMRYYIKNWLHRSQMRDLVRIVKKNPKTIGFQYYQTDEDVQEMEE